MVFACDCDPDSENISDNFRFEGIWKGVPKLLGELGEFEEKHEVRIPMTWNVRADMQIEQVKGAVSFCCERYFGIWSRLVKCGHEIAWHPHLWRWDKSGRWCQEWKDKQWMTDCLNKGFEAYCASFGKKPEAVHMGWHFHDNTTMSEMDRLGIKLDYSALPRMTNPGWEIYPGVHTNKIDWETAPDRPYFPSANDYRRPAGEPHETVLSILELPKSTVESRLFSMLFHLKNGFNLNLSGDPIRIGLAANHEVFRMVFDKWVGSTDAQYGIFTFHTGEIVKTGWHSMKNIMANIKFIHKRLGPEAEYLTITELGNLFRHSAD